MNEIAAYAPIAGLPAYLEAVKNLTFADNKPEGYLEAVATAGGTGAIHNTVWNYSEIGDSVLTSDWYWGTYNVLCNEAGRKLETYELFDENMNYNIDSFTDKVNSLLADQDSLLIIINTPAHNPTGYSLSEADWDKVLDVCKEHVKGGNKKITLLVDIAYIDYAGEKMKHANSCVNSPICRIIFSLYSHSACPKATRFTVSAPVPWSACLPIKKSRLNF